MVAVYEYIWIAGDDTHTNLRSKCRTIENETHEVPEWNFDGSSTGQSCEGQDTEIILKPVYTVHDPLSNLGVPKYLVLCECYYPNGEHTKDNTRKPAIDIHLKYIDKGYLFGLEQEYFLFKNGCSLKEYTPSKQGQYYCGNGTYKYFARQLVEEHYAACLKSGIKISGTNSEVAAGQYEFQIGPLGVEVGDHLIIARYLLNRIAEKYGYEVDYSPKPLQTRFGISDENGSGCHCNFSNNLTRDINGYIHVPDIINKLKSYHHDIQNLYGIDNHLRLTGKNETSSLDTFSYGIGTRHTSIRIPNSFVKLQSGYLEDRRPAANMDPYLVTSSIIKWIEYK